MLLIVNNAIYRFKANFEFTKIEKTSMNQHILHVGMTDINF